MNGLGGLNKSPNGVVIGLVWFLQGIDVLGGSVMSGVTMWAVIGPIVAIAGIALIVRSRRGTPE